MPDQTEAFDEAQHIRTPTDRLEAYCADIETIERVFTGFDHNVAVALHLAGGNGFLPIEVTIDDIETEVFYDAR